MRALILHFEDGPVFVTVARTEADGEVLPSELDAHSRAVRAKVL
jgi:hypothetical protein